MSAEDREAERVRRVGLNEALFREVNERVEELAANFGLADEPLDLVCECGSADCADGIRLARPEYERLRSDSRLFAIVPGHDEADVEAVVEEGRGYAVVKKHEGLSTKIAEATDSRNA